MAAGNTLLSYNFTHYITEAELEKGLNLVRFHNDTNSGDQWKLEIFWSEVVLTLTGRNGIDCSFNVKLSLMDENRQAKLELVKKGWKCVGCQESFPTDYQWLKELANFPCKTAIINLAIVKIPNPSGIADELSISFKSESFGDVEIECGDGEKFYCHKGILAARSHLFATMFNLRMKESMENRICIEDFNSDVIAALLRFVYLGDWGDLSGVADRLYMAADRYQLEQLKLPCIAEMIVNLNGDSIVSTFRLAHLYGNAQLMAGCVDYLASHKDDLSAMEVMTEATKNL